MALAAFTLHQAWRQACEALRRHPARGAVAGQDPPRPDIRLQPAHGQWTIHCGGVLGPREGADMMAQDMTRTQELAQALGLHRLLLFTGDGVGSCSMQCDYCFLAKAGLHRVMSRDTLRDAMEFLERLTDRPGLHFFGTEPTMQWHLIEEARRLRPDWPISLTTNGLLLTPERIDWMAANDVRVYVYSIDGGPEHHKHRVDLQGRPTWDRVSEHLRYLLQTQGDWVTARVTWTPEDYDLVGRFAALEALGAHSIQVCRTSSWRRWDEQRVEQRIRARRALRLACGRHRAISTTWSMPSLRASPSPGTPATSGGARGL